MSAEQTSHAALLKRGKRQVAMQIKAEASRPNGSQQLEDLLAFFLDVQRSIDFEATDWCRSLIAGGVPFSDFSETIRQYDNAKVCGLVWTANFIAYRCRTCGISPCMSLCPDCFYGGEHKGHDFNMFRSHAGGACDCGDVSVMKTEGFCAKHGQRESPVKSIPNDLVHVARMVIPRLIVRFLFYLRSKFPEWCSNRDAFQLDDGEHLLGLLHELTGLGAVMRSVISQALLSVDLYKGDFTSVLDRPHSSDLPDHKTILSELFSKAKQEMIAPKPVFYRVKVCNPSTSKRHHRRCSFECMQSAVNNLSLCDDLCHECCLEEILFWTVKYEFPEKITTWLLSLLPEDNFKAAFTGAFVDHYTRISMSIIQCRGSEQRQRVSNKVVHVSVQLFSNELNAVRMVSERQLLTRMVISLYNMLTANLSQSNLQTPKINTHQVLDCSNDILRDHCFWPLISDFVNILSHRPVAMMFMENSFLLDVWFELISFLQGMNLNERELVQHVEFENDTYYASFSAEFEISCSPLWRLLLHCKDSMANYQLVYVLRKVMAALNTWFECIGMSNSGVKINEYQVTFHLPLHRYFAAFMCSAVLHGGFFPKSELPSEFLKLILVHPLQIQVAFYEIFAQMWVRNGLQIRGQAMTYTQCHFCNSLVDLDLYLLQVCASHLEADYIVQTIIRAFHVEHWVSPLDAPLLRENIEAGQDSTMLEGCLTLLAMLLSIRTYSGQTTEEILRKEIVTLLCMSDRTYSQLCDSIPEKSGANSTPHDLKDDLALVADFKAPCFNVTGKLQQGMYYPKPEVWLKDYDPLYTMLRTVHRREFQQSMDRYTEFVQLASIFPQGQTPWPPFRIPTRPLDAYADLYNLVRCRSTLAVIFILIYKKLACKAVPVPDAALYLVVFLLQIMIHENQGSTKMLNDSSNAYTDWFPCETVFANLMHRVDKLSVKPAPANKVDEYKDEDDLMDEDTQFQDLFPSAGSSSVPVMSLVKQWSQNRTVPGAIAVPSPVPIEASSSGHARLIDVGINESLISLLIKLHNRLSDREGSYTPLSIRGDMIDSIPSLVGGGPYFLGLALDTLSSKSTECAQAIEETYRRLLPDESTANGASASAKKQKAADRQRKLMEKMTKLQNKFKEQIEKTMSKEEFELLTEKDSTDHSFNIIANYECAICASTTPSTTERPMGMVSLMQCTSVLSYARRQLEADQLPVSDTDEGLNRSCLYSTSFKERKSLLDHLYPGQYSASAALGINWQDDVFVQSCGHYLHLDCYKAYQESVNAQARMRQQLNRDEYFCPVCRQLGNTILPILPLGSATLLSVLPAAESVTRAREMGRFISQKAKSKPNDVFTETSKNLLSHMTTNLRREFEGLHADKTALAYFICSVAHTNVDYALLYWKNNVVVPSRKPCLNHLLTTLALQVKQIDALSLDSLDFWGQLTGVVLDPSPSASTSVALRGSSVPLLLRDPITLFVQLFMSLPPNLSPGYLDMLISAVYNLAYVQALIELSCKFNDEERQSWLKRPSSASPRHSMAGSSDAPRLSVNMLQNVIRQLSMLGFYPAEDTATSFLECSIWSPLSVESFLQSKLLPYLEFVAMLKFSLLDQPLPTDTADACWFVLICKYNNLLTEAVESENPSERALRWCTDDSSNIIKTWFNCIMLCKDRVSLRKFVINKTVWYMPRLLQLPMQYDTIFQYYRNRKCTLCLNIPSAPSVCLVCGEFVCFKEVCCPAQSGVMHSKRCGSGTSVILDINASIVAIIRGKRATLWGSVYLDEHGEEDRDLKRGRPLYLCRERFRMLEEQWLSHNFDYICKRWIFHADQL